MDVQDRLARLQRRTALAERLLQRQARTGIEEQPVTTIGSPPRTPAAEAVYEILLAIDPVLRRHAGLTVGIWTTPPPGTDESPDAVAMISVDPADQTLSLHFPVPAAAHPAEAPAPEPPADDPVEIGEVGQPSEVGEPSEVVEAVEVIDYAGPPAESPQPPPEPSSNGVSEWADDPDEGEVPELVERAVEHVVGRAAGRPVEGPPAPAAHDDADDADDVVDVAQPLDGSRQGAPEVLSGLSSRERLQPLGYLPSAQPERLPEQPETPERGSVAHELAALLRYPDVSRS
jgi:hypothetical protein